jgi:eukaryotic-like serine/threonine-protein kinase
MTLAAGTRLGPYEILSPLGAGGMGEVYRARDTRLGREVAVKVLPAGLTSSEQARLRFEREARTISQLSHPHICALFDVGREGDVEYLVMELLEGQTLSDRLARGPLGPEQTLRYGAQIADALDKAHRQGVVHRDLKPGNVMLASSGAKVLDFGLARGMVAPSGEPLTALPTETPLTEAGMVLGTVQYMAPEQLEGKEADARTDIFALGLVLYEMATGRVAFSGTTRASLIGAILRDDPAPISREQPLSPRALDRVVATCLAKDPEERWQTARDVALQLEGIRQERSATEPAVAPAPRRPRALAVLPWAAAAVAALAAFGLTWARRPGPPSRVVQTALLPPASTTFNVTGANSAAVAVSPDGRRLAFGAYDRDGSSRLWVRELEAPEPFAVPGGEGSHFPFWSPDSRSIGFFARGTLKIVEASRSPQPPRVLADDIVEARGGSWSSDGTILYSPGNRSHLMRVAAAGGKPEPATRLGEGETSHRWPRFLPGSRRYLYEAMRTQRARATYVASLDGAERRQVLTDDVGVTYASPGYLLFRRANDLMVAACDPDSLALRKEPAVLAADIRGSNAPGSPFFSVSENLLVYSPSASSPTRIVWLDRSGRELATVGAPGNLFAFALSTDGRSAVVSQGGPPSLWRLDTGTGRGIRLTAAGLPQLQPVVSPDGRRTFVSINPRGPFDLWEIGPGGERGSRAFLESETTLTANDISPDGRYLLYREFRPGTLGDLKVVALTGDPQPRMFIGSADDETNGDFSPDGRWVAYVSDESGRKEVYAASFPDPSRRYRVSTEGGSQPRWSRDGKELFFVGSGRLLAVDVVRNVDDLAFGQARPLFALPLFAFADSGFDAITRYDVAPEGRFLAILRAREEAPDSLSVVLNWAEMLKKP